MFSHFQASFSASLNELTQVERVGESSLLISIKKDQQSALSLSERNDLIQIFYASLNQAHVDKKTPWLKDCIVAYDTLLLEYKHSMADLYTVVSFLQTMQKEEKLSRPPNRFKIEVCYDRLDNAKNEQLYYPNDLHKVAKHTGLSEQEVISRFETTKFKVFAIGFIPYFSYLGELPQSLSVPRLKEPRLKVPKGAVAIADRQAAIYPSVTPGGWHIIGYTHFEFSHAQKFEAGDIINFVRISADDYLSQSPLPSENRPVK